MMTIGVIGCGNMGTALIRGMLAAPLLSPRRLVCWDTDAGKLSRLARQWKIRKARSNREVAAAQVVLLAVKPQQMEEALAEIRPCLSGRTLLISIAAGISTGWIEKQVGGSIPVVRVMPNTPALVGAGISAVAGGRRANAGHLRLAERIFGCVGKVVRLPERLLDAVTAVSGSGPAYFFYLMERMIEAGVKLGLSKEVARALVLQTAIGAARLAMESKENPGRLRGRVTSKGGTTEHAFRVFRRSRLGETLRRGIEAAARRAKQLGR